jgi:hypothetical protein
MLRVGVFAVVRPIARSGASASGAQIRSFSQAQRPINVLDVLRKQRSSAFSRVTFGSRTFMNETKPIISQGTAQQTSWTRYATTAVRLQSTTSFMSS